MEAHAVSVLWHETLTCLTTISLCLLVLLLQH